VDYFVKAALLIMDKSAGNALYHVTNNVQTALETLIGYAERYMKINGIKLKYGVSSEMAIRNPAEELFDRLIQQYRPYLSDTRVFERTNLNALAVDDYPPGFSYDIFTRCMDYATSVQWGETLFTAKK
jgi:hypothetical protein